MNSNDGLNNLLRTGFPPTPDLSAGVSRRLDTAARAGRIRLVLGSVAAVAAMLIGAVIVSRWNPPAGEPNRPAEVATKTETEVPAPPVVAVVTPADLAPFRSVPPVSPLALIKTDQQAWLAALEAELKEF